MSEMQTCPRCGEMQQSDLLWGLCPRCLLAAGRPGESDGPATEGRGLPEPPTLQTAMDLESFRRAVVDLGLLDNDEWSMFAAFGDLRNVARISRALIRAGKLTNYQVAAICQGKAKGLVQRATGTKQEFVVEAGGGPLAISSFNLHGDYFGRSLDIKAASGAPLSTGCVAFGVERWMRALVAARGPDPSGWWHLLGEGAGA